ncbi:MAG: hypothetical protein ACREIT_10085 [Tepidisphaeraceae bacterium]
MTRDDVGHRGIRPGDPVSLPTETTMSKTSIVIGPEDQGKVI